MTARKALPGLQAQRTALAWGRTALALIVTTLLVLRAGVRSGDFAIQALAAVVGLVASGILAIAVLRSMQLRGATAQFASPWMMASVAIALSLGALAGVAAVLHGLF